MTAALALLQVAICCIVVKRCEESINMMTRRTSHAIRCTVYIIATGAVLIGLEALVTVAAPESVRAVSMSDVVFSGGVAIFLYLDRRKTVLPPDSRDETRKRQREIDFSTKTGETT